MLLQKKLKQNKDLVFIVESALRYNYKDVRIVNKGRIDVQGNIVVTIVGTTLEMYDRRNNRRVTLKVLMEFSDMDHYFRFCYWIRCQIRDLSKKRKRIKRYEKVERVNKNR